MKQFFAAKRHQLDELVTRLRSRAQEIKRAVLARVDLEEFLQSRLRLAIGTVVLALFAWQANRDGWVDDREAPVFVATVLFLLLSLAILSRIVWKGGVSDIRRYVGMVLDNAGITYFMAAMGEDGAVMFGLYLFITFGNGLRYGPKYLHICQAMSFAGFAAVMYLDDHWSNSRMIGYACLISIVVLPLYVSHLGNKINIAKKRADEANKRRDDSSRI